VTCMANYKPESPVTLMTPLEGNDNDRTMHSDEESSLHSSNAGAPCGDLSGHFRFDSAHFALAEELTNRHITSAKSVDGFLGRGSRAAADARQGNRWSDGSKRIQSSSSSSSKSRAAAALVSRRRPAACNRLQLQQGDISDKELQELRLKVCVLRECV
jgi:hypothetical protein